MGAAAYVSTIFHFARNEIVVHSEKGNKDPPLDVRRAIKEALFKHIEANRSQHQEDLKKGSVRLLCRMHWNGNIRTRDETAHSNGLFRHLNITPIG
jgi:hypothetical protein